jgi:beta-1,4-mannosyltransferase
MLEPAWVEENRDGFDLFHVQFGFDGRHPDQLRELTALLRAHGKPLVTTVHDLRNPNHEDPALHDEQLEAIVAGSAALVTLTPRAAAQVEARFGRPVEVIPHPHVVPLPLLAGRYRERRRGGGPAVVGLHLKSMRPNMVGAGLLAALEPLLGDPGLVVRVDVHEEIWSSQAPAFRPDLRCRLEHLERTGPIDLRVHPYFSDEELYEYLREIDVALLPYRFGTHSGWLEACRDLGTAVVAPSCGCYASQGAVHSFGLDEERGLDPRSLRRALRSAVAEVESDGPEPLGHDARLRQRLEIAASHRALYERVLDS